jgi:hypothetical protein
MQSGAKRLSLTVHQNSHSVRFGEILEVHQKHRHIPVPNTTARIEDNTSEYIPVPVIRLM